MVDEMTAGVLTADKVDGADRQSRLHQRLDQHRAGQAGFRARLVDDRVAAEQRAADHGDRQRHREIERRDHAEHADRAQHDARRLLREGALHVVREAALALHLVAVIAHEIDRLLRLADRLEARLADLDQAGDADIVFAAVEDVGGAAQRRHALGPGRGGPARRGGLGGFH